MTSGAVVWLRAALVAAMVPGVALMGSGVGHGAVSAQTQAHSPRVACPPGPTGPSAFTPTHVSIPEVVGRTRVLALGRDRYGVPRPPPLTDRGKWQLAWDRASGIRPGGTRGVVRLAAHTYPWDGHGSALGNLLLTRLRTGADIRVSGAHGEQLCYRVVRRVQVRSTQSLQDYYSSTGSPRLALLVCSGRRRGPGDWSHRTIWYAVPTPARSE